MELRQLRYLVAIADEGSFTRAAARSHVAQPALSQQIRRLEREVGVTLVDRTTRRVRLTAPGIRLVERARRALAEVDAGLAELDEVAAVRGGRVAIGAMQTLGPFDLSRLLADFHARYPEVELAVREEPSETLAERLRSDALDLAFLSVTHRIQGGGLRFQRLATEEVVVVLPPEHPLAGRARLPLAELSDERFIAFREGSMLRRLLLGAAEEAGFEPRIAFESNEATRVRAMVARGLGVSLLPLSDVEGAGVPVAVASVEAPSLSRDVTLVWRAARRHGPAAAAFLALARRADETGAPREGELSKAPLASGTED
jgi:LysR family transcriptional regulator, transcription activator of glutamate synthase operon